MDAVNIYLTFNGNCEEAFNFYKSVFGTEFNYISRFGDMPPSEEHPIRDEDRTKIMHVGLPIGNFTLMGSDTGGEWGPQFVQGNNFSISLSTGSREENERLFAALAEGGQVTMPLADTFWGDYFGMCTDRFGINWMFSFNQNPAA